MASLVKRVQLWAEMIRFAHSVFALPFALLATFLAARPELPTWGQLGLILLAMVAARSARRIKDHGRTQGNCITGLGVCQTVCGVGGITEGLREVKAPKGDHRGTPVRAATTMHVGRRHSASVSFASRSILLPTPSECPLNHRRLFGSKCTKVSRIWFDTDASQIQSVCIPTRLDRDVCFSQTSTVVFASKCQEFEVCLR